MKFAVIRSLLSSLWWKRPQPKGDNNNGVPTTTNNNGVPTTNNNGVPTTNNNGVPTTTVADEEPKRLLVVQAWPEILASTAVNMFQIPVGLAFAYSSILIPQLEMEGSPVPVTLWQTAWLASMFVMVVPVGETLAALAMERLGRVNAVRLALAPHTLGWWLIAVATNFPMILVGKVLCGISYSIGTSPSIMYITEVARPELRGALISAGLTIANLGSLLVTAFGTYLDWRTVAWLCSLWTLPPLLLSWLWSYESPRWLYKRGRIAEAETSLKYFARGQEERALIQLTELEAEFSVEKESHGENPEGKASGCSCSAGSAVTSFLAALLTQPSGFKPFIIIIMLFVFQQFSGIYIVMLYSVTFLQDVGSSMDEFQASIVIGVIRLLVTAVGTMLLPRLGRRPLLLVSAAGTAITMAVSGEFSRRLIAGGGVHSDSSVAISWVPLMCVALYVMSGTIGVDLVPWTMTAELFPAQIRVGSQGLVLSLAHIIMFLALQVYREMHRFIGPHGVQWFFSAVSILNFIFVLIFLPETHNRTLPEIEEYFRANTVYLGQKTKKDKEQQPNTEQA